WNRDSGGEDENHQRQRPNLSWSRTRETAAACRSIEEPKLPKHSDNNQAGSCDGHYLSKRNLRLSKAFWVDSEKGSLTWGAKVSSSASPRQGCRCDWKNLENLPYLSYPQSRGKSEYRGCR